MIKRMFSLLLIHTLLLSLAACGGGDASVTAPTSNVEAVIVDTADYSKLAAQSVDVSELYPDAVVVDIADAADEAAGITVTNDIVYYEAGRDFT